MQPGEAQVRARRIFNAAAEHFDDLTFWDLVGARTVELAGIGPGDRVLDVCCGTGSSALPAAEIVGPEGAVVGVDLAERLLDMATAKAAARGLPWATFRTGDMTALDLPDGSFDAVVCVFGIFFVPDMAAALREMWRVLRPGGTLAITTWRGNIVFTPANEIYWGAIKAERPDLHMATPPWIRVGTPETMTAVLTGAGCTPPEVADETFEYRADAEAFWTLVLGTAYRGPLDAMGPEAAERVREATFAGMREGNVQVLTSGVLYGRAVKPAE